MWISPSSAGLGSSRSYSVFYGVYIAEEVDGVRDKVSGNTTTVDVQTLLEAFLNMSLRSAFFIDEAFFLVKSKISRLGTTFLKCWIIRFPNYKKSD
jgi:hypothetical protein